jgi:hypothetical protein
MWFVLFFSMLTIVFTGCKTNYIANSRVVDTVENRRVYRVVMAYRRALEKRDAPALLSLVSRKYYENAGTTDRNDDDYGYAQLKERVVPKLKENLKTVRLRVLVSNIKVDGERAWANYEYFYQFKYVEGGKQGWQQKNDFNRLTFAKENGRWMIISGL